MGVLSKGRNEISFELSIVLLLLLPTPSKLHHHPLWHADLELQDRGNDALLFSRRKKGFFVGAGKGVLKSDGRVGNADDFS